jgi:hypothetical protein
MPNMKLVVASILIFCIYDDTSFSQPHEGSVLKGTFSNPQPVYFGDPYVLASDGSIFVTLDAKGTVYQIKYHK